MKIERSDNLQQPHQGGKKSTPNPKGERFGDILKNAVSGVSATPRAGTSQMLPPAGGPGGFIATADRKELVGRADQLLYRLESYQKNLESRGIPMREAYTSMRNIEDRADELSSYIETLPEGDQFRDFLNRLVITASVEAIKFRRGDYL